MGTADDGKFIVTDAAMGTGLIALDAERVRTRGRRDRRLSGAGNRHGDGTARVRESGDHLHGRAPEREADDRGRICPAPARDHPGHPYYFMAPGGQVFTIAPAT